MGHKKKHSFKKKIITIMLAGIIAAGSMISPMAARAADGGYALSAKAPVTLSKKVQGKKAYYFARGYEWALIVGGLDSDYIDLVKYKGQTVTIQGALNRAKNSGDDSWQNPSTLMKYKKQKYKMTEKCKYWYITGEAAKKVSKKKFFTEAKGSYMFTQFSFYTDKNGNIYEMVLDYSL